MSAHRYNTRSSSRKEINESTPSKEKEVQTPRQPRVPKLEPTTPASASTPGAPAALNLLSPTASHMPKAKPPADLPYSMSRLALAASAGLLAGLMVIFYWFGAPGILGLHVQPFELGETHAVTADTMSTRIASDFTRLFGAIALAMGFLAISGRRAAIGFSKVVFDSLCWSFLLFGLLMLAVHQATQRWSSLIIFFDCIGAIAVVLFATEYSQIYGMLDNTLQGALSGGNKRSGRRAEAKVRQDKLWRSRMLLICGAVLAVYSLPALLYPRFLAVETLHVQLQVAPTTFGNDTAVPPTTVPPTAATTATTAATAAGSDAAAGASPGSADSAGAPAGSEGGKSKVVQPPAIMAVGVSDYEVQQSLSEWLSDPQTWLFQPHHGPDVAQRVAAFLFGLVYLAAVAVFAKDMLDAPRGLRALHITFCILHALFTVIFVWALTAHSGAPGEWTRFPLLVYIAANGAVLALHVLPLLQLHAQAPAGTSALPPTTPSAALVATGAHRPLLDFSWQ